MTTTAPQPNITSRLLSADRRADAMESRIAKYLSRRSGVSLCEMARDIPGFAGDATWGKEDLNIILWADMSAPAIAAMKSLLESEQIVPTPTTWLVYSFDGSVLNMPIARSFKRRYVKPHWFPLVFAGNREAAV